jgi:RHS repeat-associated protein
MKNKDYYPFGMEHENPNLITSTNRWGFSGKEKQTVRDLGWLDFMARMYSNSEIPIFTTQDPLSEKYYSLSPYMYCAGNPVNRIDPDGREIRGITKQDAQIFRDDIYKVLADDKFAKVRALIDVKGKTFNKIDAGALSSAMEGLALTDDESAYITMVTGTINSKDIHKVEYVSGDFTSTEGATAMKNHMNKTYGDGTGDRMLTKEGQLSTAWIRNSGDGLNVPTKNGSHSFIGNGLQGAERAVTSGHEIFGHGIPAARKLMPAENNSNAIRADNLIRRILGLPQTDGRNHGGYKEGQITNPYILPIIK